MKIVGNFYGHLAVFFHSKNKIHTAEKLYLKALKHNTSYRWAKLCYGLMLLRRGEFARSCEFLREVAEHPKTKAKDKASAELNIAIALWKMGQIDEAAALLWQVHKLYQTGVVYGALGYLLIEQGDYDEAMRYNLEALEYDSEDSVILDNVGQLYYRLGQKEKALEYLHRAVEKRPTQVDSLFYLALIHEQMGDEEQAKQYIQRAANQTVSPISTITSGMVDALYGQIMSCNTEGDGE